MSNVDFIRLDAYNQWMTLVKNLKGDPLHMDYISTQEAAIKWGISERRIQKLCEQGRINGAIRFSRVWAIPKKARKPSDGRLKENRNKEN